MKVLPLLYMISLAYKIAHCLSARHNPELRCVVCTGVTLFAPVFKCDPNLDTLICIEVFVEFFVYTPTPHHFSMFLV